MNLRHFRKIKGFENYLVSRRGKIWSSKNKQFIKHWTNNKGYRRVELWLNGVRNWRFVHRLVLSAFDREATGSEQGNHNDWDTHNNWFKNLQWMTPSENIRYNRKKPFGANGHKKKYNHERAKELADTPF